MALSLLASSSARAATFSQADATGAVRAALERGADIAVKQLGQVNGFMGNDKIRIPLPDVLEKAAPLLRAVGRGRQLDDLVNAMNHAAENAVSLALPLLRNAIKGMSVQDARQILSGGEHAVTDFFAAKTRAPLGVQFSPLVNKAVEKLSLAQRYNELAGKASSMGLIKGSQAATVQQHVTNKALDGLYFVIGEEERRIRNDPVGTGSALLKKVFSSL
ncbi:DUF4197 domain-containing protein [Aquabacterium sp.]|uniref:DUF4197 domain-containing protein n=1 Tax=Aquabacterium sp. TaxID=1872578 RepID=UPI0024883A28|nr:DUF4197 domain-containing protein [Aquabacterium sp.]MDI1259320.1 DUF4197 domain-containing protein [Aquabacterium sp.]